ncbi:aldo/keto reductase [Gracilibacillus alcaliphilus]|uniref:aldo/keto reductase n=1 Tax=Gracilibacillus alcaliphilus TaxID=1401441 RepID=UPI00195E2652|nr:aldo/keto reductase [Gracilibacillus alcaliphilus]
MKKSNLGNSDLSVSPIALGCMSLGTEKKQAASILDAAIDLGINYLDTADLYDAGRNEELVGETIKQKRNQLVLATKVGNHLKQDGSWFWDPRKSYIKEQVKTSLKRLQTDYIDLYQLHGGTIEDPIEETIEAFEELVQEGVVRYYGLSSIRPNVIQAYLQNSNIVSNMMQFSLLDRRPEEFLPVLAEHQVSVVTRGSLAKGMISTKGLDIISKKGAEGYLDYEENELAETVRSLIHLLADGQTLTGLSLQYVLQQPAVTSAVVGASSPIQLEENVLALEQSFTAEQMEKVKKITKASTYQQHRE